MKTLSILLSVVLLISGFISPQEIEVEAIQDKMEKGKQPGFEVVIPYSKRNSIKRQWKRHLRSFDNNNLNKKRKKVLADNIVIPSIRDFPLNVYTHLKGMGEDVRMRVFIQTGEEDFMNNDDDGYEKARQFIYSFAAKKAKEALSDRLDDMKDNLDDKKDELEDLKDDAEDLKETIEDCQKTIEESKKALNKNEDKQNKQHEKVDKQQQAVDQLEKRIDNIEE